MSRVVVEIDRLVIEGEGPGAASGPGLAALAAAALERRLTRRTWSPPTAGRAVEAIESSGPALPPEASAAHLADALALTLERALDARGASGNGER